MESFLVLSLYLKKDAVFETVRNLKPFLNISEEDGIAYYKFFVILKLLFTYHSLQNTFPNYLTHGLFALGNAYIAYMHDEAAIWSAILQSVFILAPGKKVVLFISFFWITIGMAMNVKAYEFILDAVVLLLMIWYALEAYRKEIQKLATVISIQLTLGWYIGSQSAFSFSMFCLIVIFLIFAYIPLKPNWHNKYRNILTYFYALMFVWVVYNFQLAHRHDNQLDIETRNVTTVVKKWGQCGLEGDNSMIENATISNGNFQFTALVENEFGEEHLEKLEKGSLKSLEVLTNTTSDECSEETSTEDSESKIASEDDYVQDSYRKSSDIQNTFQNTQGYSEKDKVDEAKNFKHEVTEPEASKYSIEINEKAAGNSLVKDTSDDLEIKLMGDKIGTKEANVPNEFTTLKQCKSLSNVGHEFEFPNVEPNLQALKPLEKDKIDAEEKPTQNELTAQESMNVNNEKEFLVKESNTQKHNLLEDKVKIKESMKTDFASRKEIKSKLNDHQNESAMDISNLQELKLTENGIGLKDESEQNKYNSQEKSKSKNIVDGKRESAEDHSNLQKVPNFIGEKNIVEGLMKKENGFPRTAKECSETKVDKSEKNQFNMQERLESMKIVGEKKEFAKDLSNLREDSKFIGDKKSEEGSMKKENSLPGVVKKMTKIDVSNEQKESHSINTVGKNTEEILKPMEPVKSHIKANSDSNKERKLGAKNTAKKESAPKIHSPRHIKRKDNNFIENHVHLFSENEIMHANDFTTEAYKIEDLPATESYKTAASETDGDQGMYLVYRHRRGQYYIL